MARVPPGRSGRLWLVRRLAAGQHAADLLDRKLRILRTEQARLAQRAERAAAAWRDASRRADTWGLRAALSGGQRALRLAATEPARVEITWETLMGARYPAGASCAIADPPAAAPGPGGAAVAEAAATYRAALQAAATHAAAEAAVGVVAAEIAATRRRLRAVTERWIPRLETALWERNRQLAEVELAETARLRWAARPGRM